VATVDRVPIVLGVVASVLIGVSDFLGARSVGRVTPLQATTAAFLGGGVAAAAYSPLLGSPSWRDLALGAVSGVALAVGLTTMWKAFARSSIGVASPVAAVIATVLPVLYGMTRDEYPGVLGWIGVAVAAVALVLTSWNAGDSDAMAGVRLGAVAGVFFSAMFVISVETSDAAGTWPIVPQRFTAFALALAAAAATRRPAMDVSRATWGAFGAGVLGAGGVAAVAYGGQRYPVAPVVVAGSMYPAVAIGLGWLILRQRLTTRQIVGLVAALVGVALIAAD
jgi:drug/metabolite transporter (DMT)-like permease